MSVDSVRVRQLRCNSTFCRKARRVDTGASLAATFDLRGFGLVGNSRSR